MSEELTYICNLSGGVASWLAARRAKARFGADKLVILFADTKTEESSSYLFLQQCLKDLGKVKAVHNLSDGRNIWQVFKDEKFLGNSRVDPCSRILKRELIDNWVRANYRPDNCVWVFGYDWEEEHRLVNLQRRISPWRVIAPLLDPPYLTKSQMLKFAYHIGLTIPLLYRLGFEHNNCGGKCVKAGQAHWARLYQLLPSAYAEAEQEENKLRAQLGNVSILRDRTCGVSTQLPLSEFKERIEAGQFDKYDYGSCSCFTPTFEEEDFVT